MHIIDPNLLAETWGIPCEQQSEGDDYFFDEKAHSFILGGGEIFAFHDSSPNSIILRNYTKTKGSKDNVIDFHHITRVVYSKQRTLIAIESVNGNTFSDMIIKSDGRFSLEVAKPMKLYKTSFGEVLARDTDSLVIEGAGEG